MPDTSRLGVPHVAGSFQMADDAEAEPFSSRNAEQFIGIGRRLAKMVTGGTPSPYNCLMIDSASISAALASAKTIIDLVRNANDAQLAMKVSGEVANLQGKLIDVQQQALALQKENHDLRDEIRQLQAKLADTVDGEPCPRCHKKGWRVASSRRDPLFGQLGGVRRVYNCRFCDFTEEKVTD